MKKFNIIIFFLLLSITASEAAVINIQGDTSDISFSEDEDLIFTGSGTVRNSNFSGAGKVYIDGDINFDPDSKLNKSQIIVNDGATLSFDNCQKTLTFGTFIKVNENGILNLSNGYYGSWYSGTIENLGTVNTGRALFGENNIINGDDSDKGILNITGQIIWVPHIKQNVLNIMGDLFIPADELEVNNISIKENSLLVLRGGTLSEVNHFSSENNTTIQISQTVKNNSILGASSVNVAFSSGKLLNTNIIETDLLLNNGKFENGDSDNPNAKVFGNIQNNNYLKNTGVIKGNVTTTNGIFDNYGVVDGLLQGDNDSTIYLVGATVNDLISDKIVYINQDSEGHISDKTVTLTNSINALSMYSAGGKLKLGAKAVQSTEINPIGKLTLTGGKIDIQNGKTGNLKIKDLYLEGKEYIDFDVDLANKKMDTIDIETLHISDPNTILFLDNIQLLSDTPEEKLKLNLFSTETSGSIKEQLSSLIDYQSKKINSNIASYDTYYDRVTSQLVFIRSFNPYVHSSAVTTQTLGLVTSDLNGIALGQLTPEKDESQGNLWVKTVGLNDRFEFDSIPTVDAEMFSVLSGVTSDKIKLGHSAMQLGAYIGYLGGTNKYASNKMEEEGGYLGLSAAWSKGNFVLDTTLNAGFVRNNSSNFYGKDKYNSTWLSAGMKAGYGFNIADFTLQPNFYVGCTMVDTEDYNSVAGVHFDNEKAYFVEYSPGLKLSKSFNSWQGYVQGKYAFFENKEGKMTVNGINLPDLSTRNYAEYGIGLSKDFSNYWQFLMQANRRDGGRTGWNGSLELKYKF